MADDILDIGGKPKKVIPTSGVQVTPTLCEAYRGHLETKIGNMEKTLKNTIYIVGATTALLLSMVQLALHFFG